QALRNERQGLVAKRLNAPTGLIWQLKIIAPKKAIRSRATQAFLDLCL
ncbi:MAG: LysR family transcriptional regulator, partial [Gammaproteobacteria bacterium HGW-Gammaproteobacteria-10]